MLVSALPIDDIFEEVKALLDTVRWHLRQQLTRSDHSDEWLVEELVIRQHDGLTHPEVVCDDEETMLVRAHHDGHVGRSVRVYSAQLFPNFANYRVARREAHITVKVVEQ